MSNHSGQHAIVIGASIAGLITARVLADHFHSVTILDRDKIEDQPMLHKSIPQGNHVHALLMSGLQVMTSLYPGFLDRLTKLGAVRGVPGQDAVFYVPSGKAYTVSGTVREPRDLGIVFYWQSRGLLEFCVRQSTLALPNVVLQSGSAVKGLVNEGGRVCGVRFSQDDDTPRSLAADFVVDAGGRGTHAPRWLTEMGLAAPTETMIGVDIAYASTRYRMPHDFDRQEVALFFMGPPPDFPNGALMALIEGDTWHVTQAGRFGDYPPADEEGFLRFAQSLHTSRLYDLIKDAERVADITTYRYPTSLRRHYEHLTAFPAGFLVLGDAICSFNPIYGQGMSSAALQVQALQKLLAESASRAWVQEEFALAFFQKAAEIVDLPWTLASLQDLSFPQTQGERPPNLHEQERYMCAIDALTAEDPEVQRLLLEVFHLVKPLSALQEEPLRSRALAHQHD